MNAPARGMRPTLQLPLPLSPDESYSRADLVVAPANAQAVAFVESWPDWAVSTVAIHGPHGCGKTHLARMWQQLSGARLVRASDLAAGEASGVGPLVIEDVDQGPVTSERDAALFAAFELARPSNPLLLTGLEPPAAWPCELPDLKSRFAAMAALPLFAPDEKLLAAVARKLLADRQLVVPDTLIEHMIRVLERSPAAIRKFIAAADSAALAHARPVNLTMVRALIADLEKG